MPMKRLPPSGSVTVAGPGIEVEDRKGIQRVAVGPDDALLDGRRELAAVPELSKAAGFTTPAK